MVAQFFKHLITYPVATKQCDVVNFMLICSATVLLNMFGMVPMFFGKLYIPVVFSVCVYVY